MIEKKLQVQNELGFHARVACRITRSVGAFQSSVKVVKDGRSFDLKSVTGVMMANAKHGDILTIEIDGPDERETANALETLFAEKFGEK